MRDLQMRISNIRGETSDQKYIHYVTWASDAVWMLRMQVSKIDIDRLVLTRRHWLLHSLNPIPNSTGFDSTLALLNTEIDDRAAALEQASSTLAREIERWSGPDALVVADTSFYLHHDHSLDQLDLSTLLATREQTVRLLVPMVVIDELDRLKESAKARTRARTTLRTLDGLLSDPATPAILNDADWSTVDAGGLPRGRVTIEVVFDPPAHVRLPSEDQELVDRTACVAVLAAKPVIFLTYDTGQPAVTGVSSEP